MTDLSLHGVDVAPGTRTLVRIPIARLPTGTLIDLPVYAFRGADPGPTLLVQGGLHGDEVNGVEILRRMLTADSFAPTAGAVLVVPILNVFGFLTFSRDVPDGKDVNRSFPGSRRGSLASRVAGTLMREVVPHVDVAIDLHTGGGRRHNVPQVRYTEGLAESRALAEAFGAPFHFPAKLIPKSFRQALAKQDKPVVVYEAGETLRLDEPGIVLGIDGILRVMDHLGLSSGPAATPSRHLDTTRWIRAPRSGLFRATIAAGDHVRKGQRLGEVADPTGGEQRAVKAPISGHVITLNHLPVVNQGDALLRLGA